MVPNVDESYKSLDNKIVNKKTKNVQQFITPDHQFKNKKIDSDTV